MHSLTHTSTHTNILGFPLKKEHNKITDNLKLIHVLKLTSVEAYQIVFCNLSLEFIYIYRLMVNYKYKIIKHKIPFFNN